MQVTLGYMPFVDSAALVVAAEKGFATDEGLKLRLVRETSWANIRDRLAVGHFQGAHMPAPLPLAANLGLYPVSPSLMVVMTLNLGGGAVTVANSLHDAMMAAGLAAADLAPASAGSALKAVVSHRRRQSLPRLRLAVGFDHSSQGYQLRYWLHACGLAPGRDIDVVALPSPLMADAMSEGAIDGFCAAEPWNSLAVDRGVGRIVTTSSAIWRSGPDKVLGVSAQWGLGHRPALDALLRALYRAAQWCSNGDNIEELAGILASPRHLDVEGRLLLPALTGEVFVAPGVARQIDDFLVLERKAAGFPWQSQALWFYSQMVRAHHVAHSENNRKAVLDSYRPDLYRQALKPVFAPMPGANQKLEGALSTAQAVGATTGNLSLGPDGFFDGRIFDPDRMESDLLR
ncbi:NitT/TauT family transport system ATP-binding protein [Agrobacterium vitis]|nr:NitT/TauT family transport system ATP-binding protein [Agrobacterium vitis]MBE1438164.1 NitT/TauT family transport system ATP-binding protein [Agrobacterium vitis]